MVGPTRRKCLGHHELGAAVARRACRSSRMSFQRSYSLAFLRNYFSEKASISQWIAIKIYPIPKRTLWNCCLTLSRGCKSPVMVSFPRELIFIFLNSRVSQVPLRIISAVKSASFLLLSRAKAAPLSAS